MHAEIHGALIGGAIAGVTVVLGVWLESWASSVRQRRADVESAVDVVAIALPYPLVPLSEFWHREPVDTGYKSEWSSDRERVEMALVRIRRNARWPMRNARKIRQEAENALVKFIALTLAHRTDARVITQDDLTDVFGQRLSHLVFPGIEPLDAQATGYVRRLRRGGRLVDGPLSPAAAEDGTDAAGDTVPTA